MSQQGSQHPVFDFWSQSEVVWDAEPHQFDGEMDDLLEYKHTMFKAAIVSTSDGQRVFDELSSQVVWDEEPHHGFDAHGLLQEHAVGMDDQMQCRNINLQISVLSECDAHNVLNENPCSEYNAIKVFDENPWSDMVWDDEECEIIMPIVQLAVNQKPTVDRDGEKMVFHADHIAGQDGYVCASIAELDMYEVLTHVGGLSLFQEVEAVYDDMLVAINTHHGLLQYSDHYRDYFADKKKVESVDPETSKGAAMPCMDVLWDDDLLGGHEYLEETEFKTVAMSRICANLDKQKMDGLSKCNKLQVYLDSSEMFARLHNRVAWDLTEIDQVFKAMPSERYSSHPTESEKGLELFWMSDFSPREGARRHNMCLQTILKLVENLNSAVLVLIPNYVLHPSLCLQMCFGVQNSMFWSFASSGCTYLFSLQMHCCDLHHGEMQKPIAEVFLEDVLTDVSNSPTAYLDDEENKLTGWLGGDKVLTLVADSSQYPEVGMVTENYGLDVVDFASESHILFNEAGNNLQVEENIDFGVVLRSVGGVVGLLSIEYTNHLFKGHLYHICYGVYSRHEMKYDCNHLVLFDTEQGICGAQYVIDDRHPWRRSAFGPGNDDMTAARLVFHQIPSWNPNDFSPWSLAWFSVVGLQKFQHGDHSNHRPTAGSKYGLERMLCARYLNVPWDPGDNHDCFIPAIAWGQAMFCGGGNVIPGTIRYMG